MTVREWLHSRTPRPPRSLADRLDEILAGLAPDLSEGIPDTLLRASEALICGLLQREGSTRDSALDLLAADTFMTYAMEAAAEDVPSLDACAAAAMCRVSAIAEALSSE